MYAIIIVGCFTVKHKVYYTFKLLRNLRPFNLATYKRTQGRLHPLFQIGIYPSKRLKL